MADWLFAIVDRLGALGVGLLIFLENVVPPIPSEVILPLAGFRARTGALDLVTVWPASVVGSVAGALVLYGLGAWLGHDRLRALAVRPWFVPFLRSVVSVPAGIEGMPLLRFVLLTAIGSGIWNAAFLGVGWLLGENWATVEGWLGPISSVVVGLLLVGLAVLVVRRCRTRRGLAPGPGCGSSFRAGPADRAGGERGCE